MHGLCGSSRYIPILRRLPGAAISREHLGSWIIESFCSSMKLTDRCKQYKQDTVVYSHVHLFVHHLFPMCTYVCIIYSHVHLFVHHLFSYASMHIPFILMFINTYTIYSHAHQCIYHLLPCVSLCTIYSHVHQYIYNLFPCASMHISFIPTCAYVHHLFPCVSMQIPFIVWTSCILLANL